MLWVQATDFKNEHRWQPSGIDICCVSVSLTLQVCALYRGTFTSERAKRPQKSQEVYAFQPTQVHSLCYGTTVMTSVTMIY